MPAAAKPSAKRPAKGTKKKKGAVRKRAAPAVSLSTALAEAAWAEADAALAQALADFEEALSAADEYAREQAMTMVGQSLSRAARKRGLTRIGELGARVIYDPSKHDLTEAGKRPPKTVLVAARGVARGGEVLARPRVARPRRRRAS